MHYAAKTDQQKQLFKVLSSPLLERFIHLPTELLRTLITTSSVVAEKPRVAHYIRAEKFVKVGVTYIHF